MLRTFYPPSLLTFLNTGAPYQKANLITLELQSGTILRLTDHDVDVVVTGVGAGTFDHAGPIIRRGTVKQKRGIEVSTLNLTIFAQTNQTLQGQPWMRAVRAGLLDYAKVTLDIAIFDVGVPNVLKGWYNWFSGQVASVPNIDLMSAEIIVKNQMSRLDILMPRNVIQPTCVNTLFDKGCGLDKAANTRVGTITAVNGDGSYTVSIPSLSPVTGFYDEGVFTFTSGANDDQVRKIKRNVTTNFTFFAPFPFPVANGDAFTVRPGCDKSQARCAVYGNQARFKGAPYVPTPETVL